MGEPGPVGTSGPGGVSSLGAPTDRRLDQPVTGPAGAAPAGFPFSAVVGMDQLKLALILNAVSPLIGGVLVRGEKGTAKSTAVRALASVLPPVRVVDGCRFSCDPDNPFAECPDGPHESGTAVRRPARLVELPIGATEDRLTGSLDLEQALVSGRQRFEPGLLAAANRGLLYVDEVNLLHDHLVDLMLDAAALGVCYVEREGMSIRHQARFLLVGTMNPEEGELRPQLLDRFGLTVEVSAPRDPEVRSEVVRRRFGYDDDPAAMQAEYAEQERELAASISAARDLLPQVRLTHDVLNRISRVCAAFEVDGLRADIVAARTAAAHAAWHGRVDIDVDDIRVAAELVLPHRRRRNPFDAPGLDQDRLDEALESPPDPDDDGGPDAGPPGAGGPPPADDSGPDAEAPTDQAAAAPTEQATEAPTDQSAEAPTDQAPEPDPDAPADDQRRLPGGPDGRTAPAAAPGSTFAVRPLQVPGIGAGVLGRRSKAITAAGKVVRSRPPTGPVRDVHLLATITAAAPHQRQRGRQGPGLLLHPGDLRVNERIGKEGNLILFLVDASGSMAARHRMAAVKGAVLSLLLDAYQRRDKVGLISFRRDQAELLLPPTSSVEAAAARLTELPTGGRTPLAAALIRAGDVLRIERLHDPRRRPLLMVVTDGRFTSGPDPELAAGRLRRDRVPAVVLDCESSRIRLGLASRLAGQLGADYLDLGELSADRIAGSVRDAKEIA